MVVEEEEKELLWLVGKSLSESSDDSIAVEVAGAAQWSSFVPRGSI